MQPQGQWGAPAGQQQYGAPAGQPQYAQPAAGMPQQPYQQPQMVGQPAVWGQPQPAAQFLVSAGGIGDNGASAMATWGLVLGVMGLLSGLVLVVGGTICCLGWIAWLGAPLTILGIIFAHVAQSRSNAQPHQPSRSLIVSALVVNYLGLLCYLAALAISALVLGSMSSTSDTSFW